MGETSNPFSAVALLPDWARKRTQLFQGAAQVALPDILEISRASEAAVFARLATTPAGLTEQEAAARLATTGPNMVAREAEAGIARELLTRALNPLNGLLLILAAISLALGDARAAIVISVMVVLAIATAFVQEHRSNAAAAKLRDMVKTTVTVVRQRDSAASGEYSEIPIDHVVPGDLVKLSAGDIIPADIRLLTARDLFVNQAALTGEAMPVEKACEPTAGSVQSPLELSNMCFMGANVVSGFASAVVVRTGANTTFGNIASRLARQRETTSFDRGVDRFTWLMIRFIVVMVPAVFLINGLSKGNWLEALMFAVAVAVGLTPEMLPMIVTVNLAKGALEMSRQRVIVKRLNAIQNFGAMDILCTDKTGTLTQDRIILKRHIDIEGNECPRVLEFAFLNSHFQSGLKNLLDLAVLRHAELEERLKPGHRYTKIDELPFDFSRRRLSVIVERDDGRHILICKGAVEEIFSVSTRYEIDTACGVLDEIHFAG